MENPIDETNNPFQSPAAITANTTNEKANTPDQKPAASWWHYAAGVAISGVLMGIISAAMLAVMMSMMPAFSGPELIVIIVAGTIGTAVVFTAVGLATSGIWRAIRGLISQGHPPGRLARSLGGLSMIFTVTAVAIVTGVASAYLQVKPNMFFSLLQMQLAGALSVEIEKLLAYLFKI